jgi:hypothetical protein
MINDIAKCGCDCINCPTYKKNVSTIDNRRKCSSGWEKFLDIKLSPEKLRACDGCSIADSERKTYYLNCKIRKCAMVNAIDNCAYCKGFPCEELLKAHSVQQITNREEFIKKTGKEISEQDYRLFIEPYAGLYRLNQIRQKIADKDFKDFKAFSIKIKFADFNSAIDGQESLKRIYSILTTICVEKNIPYAKLQAIEYKREQFIKILWAVGNLGNFNKSQGYIELDSNTFMAQKIHGMFYNVLLDYISDFKKYDIHCDIVPLIKKGWQTPLGGLRKEGWVFRLRFGDLLGSEPLAVFKDYTTRLNTKYGSKAFKIFNTADLSIMTN